MPPPVRPKSKVSGLFGIASGLGSTRPPPPLPDVLGGSLTGGSAPPPPGDATLRYVPGGVIEDKYRLTRVLGEGGMGSVWLARNIKLDVDVAIKLIRHEVAAVGTSERLLVEARSAARIGHPSIVRVYDFGETAYKDPYIVMEMLEGESLRQVLDRKVALQPTNAVQTLLPIASALEAAHLKGIIHRDVKPENVLLAADERGNILPKVVDFGIAKLRRDDTDRAKTAAGSVMGSPDYMSPEQARGRDDIDERSDVWALGVVLYETLVGECPFVESNYHAQLRAIIEDPPETLNQRGIDEPALWEILSRSLSKDRERRWPSMRAFGVALARWLAAQGVETDVTGAMLQMVWGDVARRPLSEPPPSRVDSVRPQLPQAQDDDGPTMIRMPPSSGSGISWPRRQTAPPAAGRLPSSRGHDDDGPDIEIAGDVPPSARPTRPLAAPSSPPSGRRTTPPPLPQSTPSPSSTAVAEVRVPPPPRAPRIEPVPDTGSLRDPRDRRSSSIGDAHEPAPPTPRSPEHAPSAPPDRSASSKPPATPRVATASPARAAQARARGSAVPFVIGFVVALGGTGFLLQRAGVLDAWTHAATAPRPSVKPAPARAHAHGSAAHVPASASGPTSVPVASASVPVASASVPVASASVPVASASATEASASVPVASASVPVASASATVASAPAPVASALVALAPAPVASAAPSGDVGACFRRDFPEDSLDDASAAALGAATCGETDPRKGAIGMKTALVRAARSRRVTDSMREWALMSWFELAAFAAVRADCCPSPEPLKLPAVGLCEPLDGSLASVAGAAVSGEGLDPALARMHKAIGCVQASGAANNFTYAPLTGGEETALRKTIIRIAKRRGR